MDAWCALYFWPLEGMPALPTREAWLAAAELVVGEGTQSPEARQMLSLRLGIDVENLFVITRESLPSTSGIAALVPWFDQATTIQEQQHFHHWELVFPEILGPAVDGLPQPRGFDLMLGNPPWIKVGWNDAPVLCELEPRLGVQDARSAALNRARPTLLDVPEQRGFYAEEFCKSQGAASFLCSSRLYPLLAGVQTNLYKNFIRVPGICWGITAWAGCCIPRGCMMIQRGDSSGRHTTSGLAGHYQLKNEFSLFSDVRPRRWIQSLISFRRPPETYNLLNISNLYHPSTIAACRNHHSPC